MSWLAVGDLSVSTGGSCRGGREVPNSDVKSWSREESSNIGEGKEAETGGTTKVSSFALDLGFADAFFCFGSDYVEGAEEAG